MANINIGGRLHSTASGNVVAGANEILDDSKGKKQSVINQETGEALAGKQATIEDLSTIRSGAAAGATAYQKPGTGIPKTDLAEAVQTSLGKADTAYQKPGTGVPSTDMASAVQTSLGKADTAYQKPSGGIPASDIASGVIPAISTNIGTDGSSDSKVASPKAVKTYVDNQVNGVFVTAWDGSSTPVIANIPSGVSVTYNTTTYTGTLVASSSTKGKIYLVSAGSGLFHRYITELNGSTYSWVYLGTTAIALSDYATKTEVDQLEHEVHNLSGKYYGVFADESDLPDDAVTPGYAFVGAENPYAIWNFDGEEWSDSGSVANGITGEPGVGFSSIFTPVPYDGTVIIVLSSNDTITLGLNHDHLAYPKYQLCADEAAYIAITTKESDKLYLIPVSSS